jgi:glucose-1-phosphate thymidylyltransferase
MNKGIILSGGTGSRLFPLTKIISKQLLPLYNKPMIYYPLATLMQADVKDFLIITKKDQLNHYKKLLGSGEILGINIKYKTQNKPNGIAEAIKIGENFVGKNNFYLILGDNFFHGGNISKLLDERSDGSTIYLYKVNSPENYGVAVIKNKKILKIVEKPNKFISNFAITGLYYYDNKAIEFVKKLKKSRRGELEITDLNKEYLKRGKLNYKIIPEGFAWLDTGTFDDYLSANNYISTVEKRQGYMIASLEEIALKKNYISLKKLKNNFKKNKFLSPKNYIAKIINENS